MALTKKKKKPLTLCVISCFYVFTSLLRELMLHEDSCPQAHLHVLVYVSVHADLVSE